MNIGLISIYDLVLYTGDCSSSDIIHTREKKDEIGIVLDVVAVKVGKEECESIMETIKVMWSDKKWNTKSGYYEENSKDLEVLGSLR